MERCGALVFVFKKVGVRVWTKRCFLHSIALLKLEIIIMNWFYSLKDIIESNLEHMMMGLPIAL